MSFFGWFAKNLFQNVRVFAESSALVQMCKFERPSHSEWVIWIPPGPPLSIPTKPPLKSANLLSERICGLWGKLLRAFCSIFSVDIFLGSKYEYAFEYPLETMIILLVVLTFKHINDDDDDWKWWWQWLTMIMTMTRVHCWLVLGTKKSLSWHNEVREVGDKRQLQHSHNHHSALPDLMF